MKMLNKLTVSPRVQALDLKGRYTSKPLDKEEFERVLFVLKNSGVPNAAERLMDDSGRFALDELLKTI